ncbi:hypothetical protein D1872_335160 [compost metagenome]
MLFAKRCAFTEVRHIGSQIVNPDVFGAVFILIRIGGAAFGEEQYVGLHALRVKNPGR